MFHNGPSITKFRGGFLCCATHCTFSCIAIFLLLYMVFGAFSECITVTMLLIQKSITELDVYRSRKSSVRGVSRCLATLQDSSCPWTMSCAPCLDQWCPSYLEETS